MTDKKDFQMQTTKEKEQAKTVLEKREMKNEELKRIIAKYLRNMGMPSHIKGYFYVMDAISLCVITPEKIGKVTKELYPEIAEKHETLSSRVERAIRHAIEVSWLRGDTNLINEIFGYTVSVKKAKPTNSEFIAQIAEYIRINNQF